MELGVELLGDGDGSVERLLCAAGEIGGMKDGSDHGVQGPPTLSVRQPTLPVPHPRGGQR